MKICTLCKQEKDEIEFPKAGKRGTASRCKICFNTIARQRYDSDKEKARYLDKKRRYGKRIREQNKIVHKNYRERNRDSLQARWRLEYYKRKEAGKLTPRDKKKHVEAVIRWREKNYDKFMAAHYLRKAVKKGTIIKPKVCRICGQKKYWKVIILIINCP